MRLLIIGNGGREHALTWKLAQSPEVQRIYVAPGNGGTAAEGKCENIPISAGDVAGLVEFAQKQCLDFVVVGPEAPLAAGVVDALTAVGIPTFGPTAASARLESSKAYAREFMARHDIPSPHFGTFTDFDAAIDFVRRADFPVVVKASGLAAGKGVIVPEDASDAEAALRAIMVERQFGAAGDEVVIEERLFGQEVSVLAFADGEHLALMPLAQDHKQVFDGDRGPNTGGMGVFAPAPLLTPAQLGEVTRRILQPTLAAMAAEGAPYRGVLYAGLMLTDAGPQVLEFNCRFGDPETQALLPLLADDLLPILRDCATGQLAPDAVRWSDASSACVVAAAPGYPGEYPTGAPISGVDEAARLPGVTVFHAGTKLSDDGALVTAGGRVLAVTAVDASLDRALDRAYAAIERIHFEGMHYRRDIGRRPLQA